MSTEYGVEENSGTTEYGVEENSGTAEYGVEENKDQLRYRTKQFALDIIGLVESLPKNLATNVIGKQLLRSGTSVGANYRSACRSKSTPDFISKMSTVVEEADESAFWMELLEEKKVGSKEKVIRLIGEAGEIVAMTIASINTARNR